MKSKNNVKNKKYFIGDLHLFHRNVLNFDNRPFLDIQENNRVLIQNINDTVMVNDELWIVGDLSWANAQQTLKLLKQINCKNISLVIGNHDTTVIKDPQVRNMFKEICEYKELRLENGYSAILCHYPIVCFKNHMKGWYHFYAHTHLGFEEELTQNSIKDMICKHGKTERMLNVGVMQPYMNWRPISFEEAAQLIEMREKKWVQNAEWIDLSKHNPFI